MGNARYEIFTNNTDYLLNIGTPSFHDRADKFLRYLEKITDFAGQYLKEDNSWMAISWSLNKQELQEVIHFLESDDRLYLESIDGKQRCKILPKGWKRLEELKEINISSSQGFVAMWFDEQLQTVYENTISEGIVDAGYRPHRVDQREYNDKIDDEIIAQIRQSRFVLADFTGHRGGVYYEAGYAMGLGIPVMWTCREDEIDDLHFDIRQYNCIPWKEDELADYQKKIQNRIESVIGKGSYRRNRSDN